MNVNNRYPQRPRGRRPQPRILVIHQALTRDAQLELEDNQQLNIHLIDHELRYFEAETRGYKQKAVPVEDSPFETEAWYELVITQTRQRLPQEVVKEKHKRMLAKGKPALIKLGKTFRFDLRKDRKCIPDTFTIWLRDQNLPESLLGQVQDIVCSWIENKTE